MVGYAKLSWCHTGFVIPDSGATGEQQAELGTPAPPQVIGRYRATGFARWYPAVCAPLWLLLGTVQYMRMHQWWGLAFAAVWTALAVTVWRMPRTVISNQGVRFVGRRIIPWSQVIDIVTHPNNGWKQDPPELVLRDGRRKLLELNASQVEGLRSLARKQGAPIPR